MKKISAHNLLFTGCKAKNQGGFTIAEALVSLFMIGVTLIVYSAASNSVVLNRSAKYQDLAHRIAVNKMEDMRSLSFASLPASGPFTHSLLYQLPQGAADVNVAAVDADNREVFVTVSWREPGSSVTRSVKLNTIFTKNGL